MYPCSEVDMTEMGDVIRFRAQRRLRFVHMFQRVLHLTTMSSVPRWLKAISEALKLPENKGKVGEQTGQSSSHHLGVHEASPVYQVATADANGVPHVRSQVHRSFIIPKASPQTPLLVTSSDGRAQKVTQMNLNQTVELAWWLEGSQDQFRLLARAKIVPTPSMAISGSRGAIEIADKGVRALDIAGEERDLDEDGDLQGIDGKYDWEKKRREVFEGMKPAMKASWCAPVAPGTALPSYDEPTKAGWPQEVPNKDELKTYEDKRNYAMALDNFVMIVFEPVRVDWVQLGEQPNRRTLFTRREKTDGSVEWDEEIQAP